MRARLHLLSYDHVFIIQLIEGAVEIAAPQEPAHIVLIQIHHTNITLVIFIILIIATGITTAHITLPFLLSDMLSS